eukprot:14789-Heterococcus_DN1.PRE.1
MSVYTFIALVEHCDIVNTHFYVCVRRSLRLLRSATTAAAPAPSAFTSAATVVFAAVTAHSGELSQ